MARTTYRITLAEPTRTTLQEAFAGSLRRVRQDSPRWRRCRAGALLLSLVDDTIHRRKRATCSDGEYLKIRRAIAVVEPQATRKRLSAILNCIIGGTAPAHELIGALDKYAERLRRSGELSLAANVYRFTINAAIKAQVQDALPALYRWMGSCLRDTDRPLDAIRAYDSGMVAATSLGDIREQLRIRTAQARLHHTHGRLDLAQVILDDVVRRARNLDALEILALAVHERGVLAHEQSMRSQRNDDVIRAITDFEAASYYYADPNGRCRLANDVGRSLLRIGFPEEARRACTIAYEKGRDRMGRWAAAVNLIMIATAAHDRDAFDRYRAAIARAPLPARLRLDYLTEVHDGCVVFGLPDEAKVASERAARIRRRFRLPFSSNDEARGTTFAPRPLLPDVQIAVVTLCDALVGGL